MDCRELDNLLYPYLDGELVEGDRVAIESHLASCDGCRTQADRERSMLLLIRSRAKAGVAGGAPESLRDKLSQRLGDENRSRRNRMLARLTAAAAGLAVCSVAAHHSWRGYQRQLIIQDAVSRHARAFPLE